MWPGTRQRARRRAAWIRSNGGFTFAEHPAVAAPDARLIWRASLDPGTLSGWATASRSDHPDAIPCAWLAPWLWAVRDGSGEHVALSDGWRHIRLDLDRGSLAAGNPVILHYRLQGIASAQSLIMPLRRLLDLCRSRRFTSALYPSDPRIARGLLTLRVHDARRSGAGHREIASALFGPEALDRRSPLSESLRSRARRLAAEAGRLAAGGYRRLLQRRE